MTAGKSETCFVFARRRYRTCAESETRKSVTCDVFEALLANIAHVRYLKALPGREKTKHVSYFPSLPLRAAGRVNLCVCISSF
jgi:hypothetical protein